MILWAFTRSILAIRVERFHRSRVFVFTAARSERKNAIYILMRYLTHKKTEIRLKRVMPLHQLVATTESSVGEVNGQVSASSIPHCLDNGS